MPNLPDEPDKHPLEALQRAKDELAATLLSIGDAVLVTDAQRRITRLNPVAEELTGWTQAEAAGRPVEEVFHIINEETRQPAAIPVDAVLATGVIHGLANHTLLIARDGKERPIADSAAPVRNLSGKIFGAVLVFRDVTEERQAQVEIQQLNETLEQRVRERTEELRASEERFRMIVEGVQDYAIFMLDCDGRITTWNAGAQRMKGYSAEEIIGQHFSRFYPEEVVRAGFPEQELVAASAEGRCEDEGWRVHKDGTNFWANVVITALRDSTGELRGFGKVTRDLTARREQERLNLRAQRMESIGTLAAGVAHDLNNAIAPIMMGVELLKMQYPAESKIVDMFESSARHAADMVRQLLSFAKGQEGERVLIAPRRLVREMEKIINASFPKDIQLKINCGAKLPTVMGDATQIHQVLLNLCVNARDAMPDGGTLTIGANQLEMDASLAKSVPGGKPGKYVVLRVSDTGAGIPAEIIDRIFDPFFTTKGPAKGSGLGLSTAAGIVAGHGGFLNVESELGKGSTFSAYLPANRAGSDTERVIRTSSDFHGQGETILFIDDEAAVRQVARAVLRQLNFNLLTAVDGADGLIQAALHRGELSAVITDFHMPQMDGLTFVRKLRCMLPDIPVAVASGRMEESAAVEFATLGVSNRLDKPFTQDQLADVLKDLLTPK